MLPLGSYHNINSSTECQDTNRAASGKKLDDFPQDLVWYATAYWVPQKSFSPYYDTNKVYRHILLLASDQKSTHSRLHFSRNKDFSSSITQESASTVAPPAKTQYKTLKAKTAPPEKTMASRKWPAHDIEVLMQARAGVLPGHTGQLSYVAILPFLWVDRTELACRLKICECRKRASNVYRRFRDVIDPYLADVERLDPFEGVSTRKKKSRAPGTSRAQQNTQASMQSQGTIAGAVNTARPEDSEEEPEDPEEEPEYPEEKPDSSQPAQQHEQEIENEEDEVEDVETAGASRPSYLTILEECLKECHFTEKHPPASGVIPGLSEFFEGKLAGRDVAFFQAVEAHCRKAHAVERTRELTAREKMRLWTLRQAAEQLKYSYHIS